MPNVSLNLPKVNFLPKLHKFCVVLIFTFSQGQGCHKNLKFVVPKVKDIAKFNFHEPKGEGHLGIFVF